jgi:hypothetical protein
MIEKRSARKSVNVINIAMCVNGRSIDYQRLEFADGSFEENGLPCGMKSKPSIVDLWQWAMRPVLKVKSRQLK